MTDLTKPKGYWNFERCAGVAAQYLNRVDFSRNATSAYQAARKNGWLNDICRHMAPKAKRNYWTKERCHREALKFNSRSSFGKEAAAAYSKAHKQGWLDDICRHMTRKRKPNGFWTLKTCQQEAKKFNSRKEFEAGSPAYQAALKRGWIDQICKHMAKPDHGQFHCVYVIRNVKMNKAYVGITRNRFETRINQHRSKNNRTRSKEIANLDGTSYEQLTPYELSSDDVRQSETSWVDHFVKEGWDVLNLHSAIGSTGASKVFWTKKRCLEVAQRFSTRQEFRKLAPKAYDAAYKKGWLKEITANLASEINPHGHWTKERVLAAARRHQSKKQFKQADPKAYSAAVRNHWLAEVSSHMKQGKNPNGHWTKMRCHEEALKYSTIKEFRSNSAAAYSTALQNGWKEEVCSHMVPAHRSKKWTKQTVHKEALKYSTIKEFRSNSAAAYSTALQNGWKEEVCSHMVPAHRSKKWTKQTVVAEARRYSTKVAFRDNSPGAYKASLKMGWHSEVCAHMIK